MVNKIRLGVIGAFALLLGLVELIAFFTPAIREAAKAERASDLAARVAVLFVAFLLVAAGDALVGWKLRRAWREDPDYLEARAKKLREKGIGVQKAAEPQPPPSEGDAA